MCPGDDGSEDQADLQKLVFGAPVSPDLGSPGGSDFRIAFLIPVASESGASDRMSGPTSDRQAVRLQDCIFAVGAMESRTPDREAVSISDLSAFRCGDHGAPAPLVCWVLQRECAFGLELKTLRGS